MTRPPLSRQLQKPPPVLNEASRSGTPLPDLGRDVPAVERLITHSPTEARYFYDHTPST